MSASVLLVDRACRFRAALESALVERGGRVELANDALDALARAEAAPPDVIAIADATLEDSALMPDSLCRLLERRAPNARVFRLRERGTDRLAGEGLQARSPFIPRSFGADAVAEALLGQARATQHAFAFEVAPAQLGHALVWLLDRRATGVLTLEGEGHEREIAVLCGMPVRCRSTLPSERIGALIAKHKAIPPERLAEALGWARSSGVRLGAAMVQLGLIEASELFGALARQTQEQLEAACAGGPYQARFQPEAMLGDTLDLFPVHPMSAVIGAARGVPAAGLSAALERAAARPVTLGASRAALEPWLQRFGITLDVEGQTLGAVRAALQAREAPARGFSSDALLIALLASGALRAGEAQRTTPAGMPSLPSPAGSSLTRVLDARPPFRQPELPAPRLAPPETEWEGMLDELLATAGPFAVSEHGALPTSTEEPLSLPLRVMYAQRKSAASPFAVLDVPVELSRARIDLAYYAQLDALDRAFQAAPVGSAALRKLELRRAFDRAHAALVKALPNREEPAAEVARKPAERLSTPDAPATGAAASVLAKLEPLVRQARWTELVAAIEQEHPASSGVMPAALALLYAIALKEAPPTPARATQLAQADRLGVRALGDLLGVSEDSATALVIAKRALRKRPLEWQKEPPKRFSILLMVVALVVGAAVGLALSHQSLPVPF
jgi:hypothetical protein